MRDARPIESQSLPIADGSLTHGPAASGGGLGLVGQALQAETGMDTLVAAVVQVDVVVVTVVILVVRQDG